MITFDEGGLRFNYRVVGVAIDKGRVLLQTAEGEGLWALPGGRGELMEPARETLKREMQEELNTDVQVGRLIWVVENFFTGNDFLTGDEMSCHELGFYFLMELPESSPLRDLTEFARIENEYTLLCRWHRLDDLIKVPLVPTFLRTALKTITENTEHIVHTDGEVQVRCRQSSLRLYRSYTSSLLSDSTATILNRLLKWENPRSRMREGDDY